MLMLWCEPCGVGWAASSGQFCQEPKGDGICGLKGTGADIVRACLSSTGLAGEGHAYAKKHSEWGA